MKWVINLFAVVGLTLLLLGCSKGNYELFSGSRGNAFSNEDKSRVNLIRIYSEGALESYFTSIDFGMEKLSPTTTARPISSLHDCRLIEPRLDTFRSRPESPAHLYMNKTEGDLTNGRPSEPEDVFYVGDNGNRNGRSDSAEWTQRPTQEHLQFRDQWTISASEYQFYVHFEKGGSRFSGNVQVKTWVVADGCEMGAFLCTDLDSSGRCETDEWPLRIESIIVTISPFRYPWGNYITKLEAVPFGGGTRVLISQP